MKKKRKLKLGNIFIAISLVILFSLVGIYFLKKSTYVEGENSKNLENSRENIVVEEKTYKASMVMVGDNLIHSSIYKDASDGAGGYDFTKMYSIVKPLIKNYDIAYYNQETVLGGKELGVSDYPTFNSPQEVGDAMIDAGFNLVSLASNHTMDSGEKAVLASRSYWDTKTDVLAVGSYASLEDRDRVRIVEKNHITYTMLNYTYGTNGISVPSGKEYLVNVWPVMGNNPDSDIFYQKYKEQVKQDIDSVRDKVDVLMVAMHWGIEYENAPNKYQEDMASFLASLGVDIVIGTHPHVVQPVTWIGNTLVIYSLGNFLSAHEVVNMRNRVGLMVMLDIYKKDGIITLGNLTCELLYTYYTSSYQDFLIVPFSLMEDKYLSNYRDIYYQYKKIVQGLDENIFVKDMKH